MCYFNFEKWKYKKNGKKQWYFRVQYFKGLFVRGSNIKSNCRGWKKKNEGTRTVSWFFGLLNWKVISNDPWWLSESYFSAFLIMLLTVLVFWLCYRSAVSHIRNGKADIVTTQKYLTEQRKRKQKISKNSRLKLRRLQKTIKKPHLHMSQVWNLK